MLAKFLNCSFVVLSLALVSSIILFKLVISKLKDNMKSSAFVALIAILLISYIVLAIALGFIMSDWLSTLVMFIFGFSPFIIGKLATYEKEKFYTAIQILTVLVSVIYVMLI